MQLLRRKFLIGFTLLLVMQGEFVLARMRVVVQSMTGHRPSDVEGVCCPVRISSDGVPVCVYDARFPDGTRVAALTAAELALRGVRPLKEVLDSCVGRPGCLFLDVRPPVVDSLTEKRRAERLFVLQRVDSTLRRESGPSAVPEESYELSVDRVLAMVRDAGLPAKNLWVVLHDPDLCTRLAEERRPDVGICYESRDGFCPDGVDALMLHWMRVGSKETVRRLRRHVRRSVVWDVNTPEEVARLRACRVDYLVTDEPELARTLKRR